jgi:hypothetical protein
MISHLGILSRDGAAARNQGSQRDNDRQEHDEGTTHAKSPSMSE